MAKFCRYCGKEVNEDAVFCRFCGRSFNGVIQNGTGQAAAQAVKQAVLDMAAPDMPGETVLGEFSDIAENIPGTTGEFISAAGNLRDAGVRIRGAAGAVKNAKSGGVKAVIAAIVAVVMVILWIVQLLLMRAEIDNPFTKILSFLTFAEGGIGRNPIGFVGGIFGKGMVVSAFAAVLGGGAGTIMNGVKRLFSGSSFKMKSIGPLFTGAGAALLLYQFFTGDGGAFGIMAALSGALVSLRALGGGNGFISGLIRNAASKASGGRKSSGDGFLKGIMAGSSFGFMLAIPLSAIPFKWTHLIIGIILLIFGILFTIIGKDNMKRAGAFTAAVIVFAGAVLPFMAMPVYASGVMTVTGSKTAEVEGTDSISGSEGGHPHFKVTIQSDHRFKENERAIEVVEGETLKISLSDPYYPEKDGDNYSYSGHRMGWELGSWEGGMTEVKKDEGSLPASGGTFSITFPEGSGSWMGLSDYTLFVFMQYDEQYYERDMGTIDTDSHIEIYVKVGSSDVSATTEAKEDPGEDDGITVDKSIVEGQNKDTGGNKGSSGSSGKNGSTGNSGKSGGSGDDGNNGENGNGGGNTGGTDGSSGSSRNGGLSTAGTVAGVLGSVAAGIAGAAAAAAGGASGQSLDEIYDEDTKDYSTYKMIVYKDFGDTINKGKGEVYVYARMVEYRPISDHTIFRNDLTAKIRCFSGDGHLTVEHCGITNNGCDWATAKVNAASDNPYNEGQVSFKFTGKGGTFTRNVRFKLGGQPKILFLSPYADDGKVYEDAECELIKGSGIGEKVRFFIADCSADPEEIIFSPSKGLSFKEERDPGYEHAFFVNIGNETEPPSEEEAEMVYESVPYEERRIKIKAVFKDKSEAENDFLIRIYPEGIIMTAGKHDIDGGRLLVNTLPNENAGEGMEMDIKPTYFTISVCYIDKSKEAPQAVIINDANISLATALDDRGAYGDTFSENFKYDIKRMPGSDATFLIAPKVTLPMMDKPYLTYLRASYKKEGLERDLPLLIYGEGEPQMPADWQREYDALKKDLQYFGIADVKGISDIIRNARAHSANELCMVRKIVIKSAIRYYEEEARFYMGQADYYDNLIFTANIIKWFGDQAFSYLVTVYAGGPFAEAVLSPLKDVFTEFAGEHLSSLLDGTKVSYEDMSFWGTTMQVAGKAMEAVMTGETPPTPKNLGIVIASYLFTGFINHYYYGGDEAGDIYKSLIACTNDLSMTYLKAFIGNSFKDWIKGNPAEGIGKSICKYLQKQMNMGVDFNKGLNAISKWVEEILGFTGASVYEFVATSQTALNPLGVTSIYYKAGTWVIVIVLQDKYAVEFSLLDNMVNIAGYVCDTILGWFVDNSRKVPVEDCRKVD